MVTGPEMAHFIRKKPMKVLPEKTFGKYRLVVTVVGRIDYPKRLRPDWACESIRYELLLGKIMEGNTWRAETSIVCKKSERKAGLALLHRSVERWVERKGQ